MEQHRGMRCTRPGENTCVALSLRSEEGVDFLLFLSTFVALLFKCVLFYGFMRNATHTSIEWYSTYVMVLSRLHLYIAYILIFLSFAFLCKKRAHVFYLICVNAAVSAVLIVDLLYVRAFNTMPTVHVIQQLSNLRNLSGSIFLLVRAVDLLFIADLAVFLILAWKKKAIYRALRAKPPLFFVTAFTALPILLYIPIYTNYFGGKDQKALFKLFDPTISCYNLSPIGYHILDLYLFMKEGLPLHLPKERQHVISEWYAKQQENLPDNRYKGIGKGKNLIMIQVESLENFVLKRSINGQEITPTLNRMLKSSLYFPNMYEQVNHGTTSDAEFMSNTSLYPLRKGSVFFSYPNNLYHSLPSLLKEKGYHSYAMHADNGTYWNWAHALRAIGFDETIDRSFLRNDESFGMGISDGTFFQQIVPIFARTSKPFYAFVVTLSSHSPYNLPQKHRTLKLEPTMEKSVIGGYVHSINYVDRQVERLLKKMKESGMLENSVIVIYGDHEGIHKYCGTEAKAYPKLENGKRVPLIIYSPGLAGKTVSTVGGQIDILPTVSYVMGIEEAKYTHFAMGRNLLKTSKSFAILSNGTYIGPQVPKGEMQLRQQGLTIADEIIKGDYFRIARPPQKQLNK